MGFRYPLLIFLVLMMGVCAPGQAQDFNYREQPDSFWTEVLPPEVWHICRNRGTEPSYSGKYDQFYQDGMYYCACCGGDYPLFDSRTKYDSKTGWPSFWQPIDRTHIIEEQRWGGFWGPFIEIRCTRCDSHLGDLFDDGPKPTGLRYCINSLALVFFPRSQTPVRTFSVTNATKDMTMKHDESFAIFAGGCFWCVENDFAKVEGVLEAVSGYTGGSMSDPSYEQVSRGGTGHVEAVKIRFDPDVVSYSELLKVFWRNVDPFDDHGQFCDKGTSYRAAIFALDEAQEDLALQSKADVEKKLGRSVVTEILQASSFYQAEDYHQDYAKNNPIRYNLYRTLCGRDKRLRAVWGQ